MKIVLSPSKTMELNGVGTNDNFNEKITKAIIKHMQSLNVEEIMSALKIKKEKAQDVKNLYVCIDEAKTGKAIESFTGLVFKNLAWNELSESSKNYAEKTILIFSALYGILQPSDIIKIYRLDFENKIFKNLTTEEWAQFESIEGETPLKKQLIDLWRKSVNEFLKDEDFIINLASKEYSAIIDHPRVYTVIFEEHKNGVWKQLSTMSKQMRGKLAHYILEHEIASINELPEKFQGFIKIADDEKIVKYRKQD